jgi:hypothetical protein
LEGLVDRYHFGRFGRYIPFWEKPAASIFMVEESSTFWRNLQLPPFGQTNPEYAGSRFLCYLACIYLTAQ